MNATSLSISLARAAARIGATRSSQRTAAQLVRLAVRHHSAVAYEEEAAYVSPLQDMFRRMQTSSQVSSLTEETGYEYTSPAAECKTLKCGLPESVLRFTTTTYGRTMLPPYVHPKEHSVVVKVNLHHLPLNDVERAILKDIVGSRYNEARGELRMQSDQFASRIENKRHLVSMLDRIILSCQRLGKEIEAEQKTKQDGDDAQSAAM